LSRKRLRAFEAETECGNCGSARNQNENKPKRK
jgi:hypothetical protein